MSAEQLTKNETSQALDSLIAQYQQLLQSCREGKGHEKGPDGIRMVHKLMDIYGEIGGWEENDDEFPLVPAMDYHELRKFRIGLGTFLAGEIRQAPQDFQLARVDGPYQELLRLVRESSEGFGLHRFDLRDCGVTAEEERRWDSNECAYSDMAFWSDNSYDDFDD